MSLERDIAFFMARQEKFAEDHHGQFVVIHEETVEGFYDNQLDAYLAARAKFPAGSFLPCLSG